MYILGVKIFGGPKAAMSVICSCHIAFCCLIGINRLFFVTNKAHFFRITTYNGLNEQVCISHRYNWVEIERFYSKPLVLLVITEFLL